MAPSHHARANTPWLAVSGKGAARSSQHAAHVHQVYPSRRLMEGGETIRRVGLRADRIEFHTYAAAIEVIDHELRAAESLAWKQRWATPSRKQSTLVACARAES